MSEREKLNDYDSEPVIYCSKCYSLKILYEDAIGADCCGDCGCSDMMTSSIEEWEELYKKRYGHKFVEANNDIRKSPFFILPIKKLKAKVYDSPEWNDICKKLYSGFPEGLSKSDAVVLLFAKLCNDNRLDDLRVELINRLKK